jgi:spermidine/putrescine transport system ATP-binding protein
VTHDQDEAMTVSDRLLVMRAGRIEQSGRPADVYERPVNRFVAEFLGSANLIAGTRAADGVQTPHGLVAVSSLPQWEQGTLAIRPERIRILEKSCVPFSENVVSAKVREVIYRGDHADVFVEPGDLRVRTEPRAGLTAGVEVRLELPAEYLVPLED